MKTMEIFCRLCNEPKEMSRDMKYCWSCGSRLVQPFISLKEARASLKSVHATATWLVVASLAVFVFKLGAKNSHTPSE